MASLLPRVALLALLLGSSSAAAVDEDDRTRIAHEIEETLLRLQELGAIKLMDGGAMTIEREPRMRYELGAVISMAPGEDDFPVVAITPGGYAEKMGLRVGDRIVTINGVRLATSDDPTGDFARAVGRDGGTLNLRILRDGEPMQLLGKAEAIEVPGFRLRIERPRLRDLYNSYRPPRSWQDL